MSGKGCPVVREPRASVSMTGPWSLGPAPRTMGFSEAGWCVVQSAIPPRLRTISFMPRMRLHWSGSIQIAGRRWTIEECFQQAKQLTGLDEYEVRSWIGWYWHITLSMLAHAMLVVIRVSSPKTTQPKKSLKALIPLTVPEGPFAAGGTVPARIPHP